MKRYFFSIAALCLAVGFTAFTKISSLNQATKLVVFDGNPADSNSVKNPANWKEIDDPGCEGNDLACSFRIASEHVTTGSSPNTLNPTVTVLVSSTIAGYVPTSAMEGSTPIPLQDIENREADN